MTCLSWSEYVTKPEKTGLLSQLELHPFKVEKLDASTYKTPFYRSGRTYST